VNKKCTTNKRSGRRNSREGSDGYDGNYKYKTKKRSGNDWSSGRKRCVDEKSNYDLDVNEKENYN